MCLERKVLSRSMFFPCSTNSDKRMHEKASSHMEERCDEITPLTSLTGSTLEESAKLRGRRLYVGDKYEGTLINFA